MIANTINIPANLRSTSAKLLTLQAVLQRTGHYDLSRALRTTANSSLNKQLDIFITANKLFKHTNILIEKMDGDAIVHIRETADLYSKRSQFHNQHFKMAQAMLEHAHTLEKKLEAVELMIRSSKMARRDANRITMVFYGIQAAKTALELAPLAQDEIQIRKCLDLAFDAAGLISMDGISYYNLSFAN